METHSLIKKYLSSDKENVFYTPCSDDSISLLENQLEFPLPNDYKEFLKVTNGFDGCINEFYVCFESCEHIHQSTLDACNKFFPWAIYIGTNGGGEMFVIDKREKPCQYGIMPFIAAESDLILLGEII